MLAQKVVHKSVKHLPVAGVLRGGDLDDHGYLGHAGLPC